MKEVISAIIVWETTNDDGDNITHSGSFTSCELSETAHKEIHEYIRKYELKRS